MARRRREPSATPYQFTTWWHEADGRYVAELRSHPSLADAQRDWLAIANEPTSIAPTDARPVGLSAIRWPSSGDRPRYGEAGHDAEVIVEHDAHLEV